MRRCFRGLLGIVVGFGVCSAEAVEFNLFGDSQLAKSAKDISFDLGALDLSVEHNASNASVITADLLFESGEHGYEIEIERLKISRQLTPTLNLSMGRMVSGQGFWQQNFHHGSLSQDTITLPMFLENLKRHDGIITAHATGLALSGKWGSFSSFISLTNPGGIDTNPTEVEPRLTLVDLDHGATGKHFTNLLRFAYSPNWKSEFGILVENKPIIELAQKSTVLDPLTPTTCSPPPEDRSAVATGDLLFRVLRGGLDYYYNGESFYTYMEYSRLSVKDGDFLLRCYNNNGVDNDLAPQADRYQANAYYIQLGYRLDSELAFTVRHEALDIADQATLYEITDWQSQKREVFAISYRFDASNALRFEVNKTKYSNHNSVNALEDFNEVRVQWFFLVL